jgi:hypothetical protein
MESLRWIRVGGQLDNCHADRAHPVTPTLRTIALSTYSN